MPKRHPDTPNQQLQTTRYPLTEQHSGNRRKEGLPPNDIHNKSPEKQFPETDSKE
ncbi:MAG: hypothetical protein R3B71_06065 [Candidatus Gracilibacteria bacterium]